MIFWLIAMAVTAIVCVTLLYAAARRAVNAGATESGDPEGPFRLALAGIAGDLAAGKIGRQEAELARSELAREVLRTRKDRATLAPRDPGPLPLALGLIAIVALAWGIYGLIGRPDLPAQPLAGRTDIAPPAMDLNAAIARIEAQLAAVPEDVRGWSVIAPAYVEMGRYAEAAHAYRRVMALAGPSAELRTDLAEALLLAAQGAGSTEAMDLLRTAAAEDPTHIRSRLYLGAELTRLEEYAEAIRFWQAAIALAQGDEPWLAAARQGLAVAENGGVDVEDVDSEARQQAKQIATMVESLNQRLAAQGGTVEEWTQLVRSYIVLGDPARAQAAYDAALAAYPAAGRGDLDRLAQDAGLTIGGQGGVEAEGKTDLQPKGAPP